MSKKSKVYAVARGAEGAKIYNTWNECERNVKGVKNSRYKSFPNKKENPIILIGFSLGTAICPASAA